MNQIESCTKELVKAIQESDEYTKFCELREQVRSQPDLRRQINAYRRQVFRIHNSQGNDDAYDELQRIQKEYEDFRKIPLVDNFLKSELRVCRTIQQVTLQIASAVELDTQEVTEEL